MIERLQILWLPEGGTIPTLGARPLVDVTDGDTPNIRMPIRLLSVDTPRDHSRIRGRRTPRRRAVPAAGTVAARGRAPISRELF